MNTSHLHRLLEFLAGIQWAMAVFWLGLAAFTAGLAVLLYTRWGQYQPLRKCMALSLLAHLLLACYAATIQIITPVAPPPEPVMYVTVGDDATGEAATLAPSAIKKDDAPWEMFSHDTAAFDDAANRSKGTSLARRELDSPAAPERLVRLADARLPGGLALGDVAIGGTESLAAGTKPLVPSEATVPIQVPAAQRRNATTNGPDAVARLERLASDIPSNPTRTLADEVPAALFQSLPPSPRATDGDAGPTGASVDGPSALIVVKPSGRVAGNAARNAAGASDFAPTGGASSSASGVSLGLAASEADRSHGGSGKSEMPDAYRLRTAPNRNGVARQHGGTAETETAVAAALRWLADRQSADGRWDPRAHSAGREDKVQGRDRLSAGSHADTAVTGLALLAFLASGHTHLDGHYREEVRRGLEFLMRTQAADGNLAGDAAVYEFMYCHGMATCALSEAYGMTQDGRLREPVRRALDYTIKAQDPIGGGWRYRPGDAGDTSQLGWQLMALKSGELAGFPIPEKTRRGIARYLQSVAAGEHGGRASYRPGEMTTRTMTAEAMVCRQFLGLPSQPPAEGEACAYLLTELPGEGLFNLYYWYYATLGMYQLQGDAWQRWNHSLRAAVVRRQVKEGPLAGSWNTDDLWGGHGGRLYTTALATLTLEVYYRFLPLYAEVAQRNGERR